MPADPAGVMPGAPPKYLRRQVRLLQHPDEEELLPSEALLLTESEGRLTRLRRPGELDVPPRSLPVLRAFQDFLAHERRKARNRMLFMTLFFAAVLIAVVGAAFLTATLFLDQTRGDVGELRTRLETVRAESSRLRRNADAALDTVETQAARLREQIRLDREGLSAETAGLASRLASYTQNLSRLSDVVAMLRLENATLRDDVAELRTAGPAAPAPAIADAVAEADAGLPEPASVLTMTIAPRDSGKSYTWRLPLPAAE
ncbi:MAG: hypothetical protein FJ225_02000 [Lentisphaerae bacterium]|nr:hypothetical protein [Lentisphaerota bacterium]